MEKKFSLKNRQKFRSHVKVDPDSDCWLWTGALVKGYGSFYVPEIQQAVRAHRYLWILKNGPVPKGFELDHICNNKPCVNPAHLEAVTHRENMKRAALCGVWAGEKSGRSKLTENQVLAIRVLNQFFMLNGLLIAKGMKTPFRNIYYILKNETWQNVKLPKNLRINIRSLKNETNSI